jgi:hypothetical protein
MMDMMGECCVIKANHAVNAPNANGFVPTPPAAGRKPGPRQRSTSGWLQRYAVAKRLLIEFDIA